MAPNGWNKSSGVEIEYLGWIESIEKWESITWSCTLFTAKDLKGSTISIVIDAGMHQGIKDETEKNAYVDPRILDADYLVITHAHIDHIGKIPLLIKEGFKWKIYMSSVTKQIAIESFKDSAEVMKQAYLEIVAHNKRVWPILKAIIILQDIENKLRVNGLKKHEREKIERQKAKITWKYAPYILESHRKKYPNLEKESEITEILPKAIPPIYGLEDVLNIVNKISTLDAGEETALKFHLGSMASDVSETPTIKWVSLSFHNAWHIAWSVQAEISLEVTRIINGWKVIIDEVSPNASKNYFFSWDLWRGDKWNMSWNPISSPHRADYIQMESTYAWRNHPERAASQEQLLQVISQAPWKVIIPAFAVQRAQEVLVLLLAEYERNIFPQIQEKRRTLRNKELLEEEKQNLRDEIDALSYEIVLDSPLATRMTDIYINTIWGDFSILDPEIQKQKFGRVIIQIMWNRKDYKKLYEEKQRQKKHIIVSSWGMCQWGAIISHLKENIKDSSSTIAFIWYTPTSTLGYDIKNKQEVIIEWEVYPVLSHVHDIWGFSWHIWHDEIVSYMREDVKVSAGCIVALTHWGDARWKLQPEIKKPKGWKVIIPKVWDVTSLAL